MKQLFLVHFIWNCTKTAVVVERVMTFVVVERIRYV